MNRKLSLFAIIVFILFTSVYSFADKDDVKTVADLVQQRLQWSGFWYGESRIGLPYGEKLPVLIKPEGDNKYEIVVNRVLDIPGYDGEIVPFNVFLLDDKGRLIEQQSDVSHLRVPDELDEFKDSGAIYRQTIVLDPSWEPVQGDDSVTTRVLDELIYDMDRYFTVNHDSFPSLEGKDTVRVRFNLFTAKDREVYMLADGIDQVFVFKIHMPWLFPDMHSYFWHKKDIKMFNPTIIDKVKQYSTYHAINFVDDSPGLEGMEAPVRLEVK
ncbi:MAG: hypothetical protein GF315_11905 [candidate division Zixibacteria bacterium]|nr:hypothetical protein [candidate division Zixibacteria bacterium]